MMAIASPLLAHLGRRQNKNDDDGYSDKSPDQAIAGTASVNVTLNEDYGFDNDGDYDCDSDIDLDDDDDNDYDDVQTYQTLLTLSSPALLPSVITEGLVDSMKAFNFLYVGIVESCIFV